MNLDTMSLQDRLAAVLRKAAAMLPGDVGHRLLALISPWSLATMAVVVTVWAGSHFVGAGEIADVALLAAGWLMIGGAALTGCAKLLSFATGTYGAHSESDLDQAARDLSDAIGILGVDVALGLLFRAKPEGTFKHPYRPEIRIPGYGEFARAMPPAGPTRMYEARIVFTRERYAGQGGTNLKNVATIGTRFEREVHTAAQAFRETTKTVHHERVHQRLTQAFSLLGRPALYVRMGAYKRSFILRYIEEAAAETYALARLGGRLDGEVAGYRFPLSGNYGITLQKLGEEARGILLGPVTVGGAAYHAYYGLIDEHR